MSKSSFLSGNFAPLDNSVTGAKIAMGSDAQGDVLYYNGSDYARLAAGTSGQFLKTQGSGANPVWASANASALKTDTSATSGTTVDFTSIPSGVTAVEVMFEAVSLSGTDHLLVQLGDSGGFETSGYNAKSAGHSNGSSTAYTTGFGIYLATAANNANGTLHLRLKDSSNFTWVADGITDEDTGTIVVSSLGVKSLSAELTQIRITTNGSNTFDGSGSINIQYW